jgi:homoserine O-acetyltransferase
MTQQLEPDHEGDLTFAPDEPFALDGGGSLCGLTQHYAWYGTLNPARDNVVLVCHALSGSARIGDWWPDLLGPGKPFDTTRFAVLGINMLGSCYGSTGPTSLNPATRLPYGSDFPVISIPDMVRAQARLIDHLGISRLHAVVGGSIGGMQALAWAVHQPDRLQHCIAIGAAPLGSMALALSHLQCQAIRSDPAWRGGHYPPGVQPAAGLALARAIAMCSYKSADLLHFRFQRKANRYHHEDPTRCHTDRFDVAGFLDYQGRIFVKRFDAYSYLVISRAIEIFDLGHDPEQEAVLLRQIRARMLLVGISSDWLFPPEDVRNLVARMNEVGVPARYAEIETNHGHDGFLAHPELLSPLVIEELLNQD